MLLQLIHHHWSPLREWRRMRTKKTKKRRKKKQRRKKRKRNRQRWKRRQRQKNQKDDAVWLFSGTKDTVVDPGVVQKLHAYYTAFGVQNLVLVDSIAAEHSMPTLNYGSACAYRLGRGQWCRLYIDV